LSWERISKEARCRCGEVSEDLGSGVLGVFTFDDGSWGQVLHAESRSGSLHLLYVWERIKIGGCTFVRYIPTNLMAQGRPRVNDMQPSKASWVNHPTVSSTLFLFSDQGAMRIRT
jgi:hypothetical protein